jgi:probable rRNA maturation factor
VLCPAVTERQARENQRSAGEEAEYLLVHGLLHLLGYDHSNPEEQAEMFGLTDKIISAWAVQRIDRARGSR